MVKRTYKLLVLAMLVAIGAGIYSLTRAYTDTKADGHENNYEGTYGPWRYTSNASGTNWDITVPGYGTVSISLEDGQTIPNAGNIQGYSAIDYENGSYNPMSEGTVYVYPEDVVAALRAMGYGDMADAVESGANYDVWAEQIACISSKDGKYNNEWLTLTQVEAIISSQGGDANSPLYYAQKSVIDAMRKTWSDVEEGIEKKGHYSRQTVTPTISGGTPSKTPSGGTPSSTPSGTPSGRPTPNVSLTPVKAPSRTPTPTKTPTPSPSPTPKPTPLIPSIGYVLEKVGDANCSDSHTLKTTLEIDNEKFGVAAGNPIPTSEDLTVSGTTNWLAKLSGIENWQLRITCASNVKLIVKYIAKVEKEEYEVSYIEGEDGKLKRQEKELTTTIIDPHDYKKGKDEGKYKEITPKNGQYGIGVRYNVEYDYIEDDEYINDKLIGKTVGYIVTAGANTNGTSKVGVGNMVFLNGIMEADVTPDSGLEVVRLNGFPKNCIGYGDAAGRVSKNKNSPIEEDCECCQECAEKYIQKYEPEAGYFFKVKSDGKVEVIYNKEVARTSCNKNFYTEDFGVSTLISFTAGVETIGYWKENKSAGTKYDTTWAYHETADVRHWIEDDSGEYGQVKDGNVNDVRVHTPIHNELGVNTKYPNQLENGQMTPSNITVTKNGVPVFGSGDDKITGGSSDLGSLPSSSSGKYRNYEIVTMGDEFEVKLTVFGTGTEYYDKISGFPRHMLKYIKYAELHCEICNITWDVTNQVKVTGEAIHKCRAYVNRVDDLQTFDVTSKVIAENKGWISGVNYGTAEANNNKPDNIYTLTQSKGILIVGKIYDLQIRTVNDLDWKIKAAEGLSKLPTGEQGDNSNKTAKDGIKLGYRAYFDLKTLGSVSNELEIIPKIYYVNKTTGKMEGIVGDNLEMWIKTGTNKTDWDKLNPKDIIVKMQMNNTNGSVNNPLFVEEQSKMIGSNILSIYSQHTGTVEKIDYTKNLTIGGLLGTYLIGQNSVATKYNIIYKEKNVEKSKFAYTSPETKSRRWLGEIYIPATARIIKAGDYNKNKQKVMNNKEIYQDGYLLLTFEVIRTRIANNLNGGIEIPYLRYDEVRDSKWRKPSDPKYSASGDKSELVIEKAGKGETVANPIKLPNGKSVTNLPADFYKTTAPMIIYDVSLRANDDIEDLATH
jgi:hypothetical protein